MRTQSLKPDRVPWSSFSDVVLHAPVPAVKNHAEYWAAKSGNVEAAAHLVRATMSPQILDVIAAKAIPAKAVLVSVHAVEEFGTNAIPEAFARAISETCGHLDVDDSIVQINIVSHTGASGFDRLARQALFDGTVQAGRSYVIVDAVVGQGGTIANLRGFISKRGGDVILAVTLTGKPHSVRLAPDPNRIHTLRRKHGTQLEDW
jgi:hypothetical protein